MNGQTGTVLHENVRHEIMRRVRAGEYAIGESLPSTAALAEEFAVSPITIKRALRDLQPTGILRSVPGLGTFVREQRRFVRDLDFSLTSHDDALRLGLKPTIRLLSLTQEKIQDPAFDALEPPDGLMLCVRKVISTDGTPIMYDTSYLPRSLSDEVVGEFGEKFISDALRAHGTQFTKTKLLIDAAPASEQAQQTFTIKNGYPTLRRLYRLSTTDKSFSVFGVTESPFDRLACVVELDARSKGSKSKR
ncbi:MULTISPECIES: GntR family transcriptional regulator [unclassified Mesorhizobium]|uniref:GntR family transcriptional regulator n=1 Tax=unclassified Mesorhizobium TaxID=325217 RepID=UPI00112E58B0|nr:MULTISPECIES: GntR family transcriptional regulator [unclassified Mesorhizobium]MBZ9982497.1 GntR family transcriptional regulator [Mesorhizobium sp. BR-1-1-8]TPL32247.1 GntR family transcriptional regulator [Mesorhizobium sp. B2-4-8]TPL61174.1 GntR family transcriptional regulator [Mesorhizobium sp. B2-4-1]